MSVKISVTLPKGPTNGLDVIEQALINTPSAKHVIIAVVDCKTITTDAVTDETVPTARVCAAEAFIMGGPDTDEVMRLWRRQAERRGGQAEGQLPFDLELALDEITDDPATDHAAAPHPDSTDSTADGGDGPTH